MKPRSKVLSLRSASAFPPGYRIVTDRINEVLTKEKMSRLAGIYRYDGTGFGGDFTLTLAADGTWTFSEGPLSSYLGGGSWFVYDNAVYMTEENGLEAKKEANMYSLEHLKDVLKKFGDEE